MQSEPEQIVQQMSNLALNEDKPDFEMSVNKAIQEAKRLRPSLSDEEIKITKELARPFSSGGLLVLLQQPKLRQPWSAGLDTVIKKCLTLDSLEEGLRLCGLDMRQDVSLLDLWTCLPKEVTETLKCEEKNFFSKTPLAAIKAKKPDCILCLGKDALNALKESGEWSRGRYFGIRVVDACHPGFVFGHNEINFQYEATRLKQDIHEACRIASRSNEESVYLFRFTELLGKLCFSTRPELIEMNVCKDSWGVYVLGGHQNQWLEYAPSVMARRNLTAEAEAMKALIPIFKKLNQAWKRDSYFGGSYILVNREVISTELRECLAQVEDHCYTVAGNRFLPIKKVLGEFPKENPVAYEDEDVWRWLGDVVNRAMRLWTSSKKMSLDNYCYIVD
ncbi:hypothetical protein E4U21_000489 [Claviceps maximensis]|nr:hypothetical protein E4U21_000489 [Claviceps maximensis]